MEANVVIEVNNKNYTGWNRASITRSMETFLGSFTLELVENTEVSNPFGAVQEGDPCKIYVLTADTTNPVEILTGFITEIERVREGSTTSMQVSGVDRTVDLMDCSAIIPGNTWSSATIKKIAEDLAKPYNITVKDTAKNSTVNKNFTVQNGESCFNTLERAARSEAVLPLTNRYGELELTQAVDKNSGVVQNLVDGENLLYIKENKTTRGKYSEYTGRGQNSGQGEKWDTRTTQLEATAKDTTVSRYRPLVLLSEEKTDQQKLQNRVNWEAQVRYGRARNYTVKVLSWFIDHPSTTTKPVPWVPNVLVNLLSTPWSIESKFMVTAVVFELDAEKGATTTLELKDPITYAKDPTGDIQDVG